MGRLFIASILSISFLCAPAAFACPKHSCKDKDGAKCECSGGCECGDKHQEPQPKKAE